MTRAPTIVFVPIRLVPGHIPDQPGAGSHRFAPDRITERLGKARERLGKARARQ
jgi:hypothetical protein